MAATADVKIDFRKSPNSKPTLVMSFAKICTQFSTTIDTIDTVTITLLTAGAGTPDLLVTLGAAAVLAPDNVKATQQIENGIIGDLYEVAIKVTLIDSQEYERFFHVLLEKVGSA